MAKNATRSEKKATLTKKPPTTTANDETQLLLFTVSAPPRPNPFKASLEVNMCTCTVFGAPEVDMLPMNIKKRSILGSGSVFFGGNNDEDYVDLKSYERNRTAMTSIGRRRTVSSPATA
ncbi:hypothetical protein PF008_g18484 [Phytophthora fragariae]|uniref:Uncharacterized protein n=1 Tax=Phytophthora fragariae TaxID=53985 RepID=A0A6G0R5Z9_9STRA|nr:hypothetical protein PF008_g18484 [Phytophthora fragariae]